MSLSSFHPHFDYYEKLVLGAIEVLMSLISLIASTDDIIIRTFTVKNIHFLFQNEPKLRIRGSECFQSVCVCVGHACWRRKRRLG